MMHWLDLVILGVLALGVLRGWRTGVARQVVSILGVFVSFGLAVQLMDEVGAVAAESLPIADSVAPLLGFVLVFLGAQILVRALVHIVESMLEALRLTTVNRAAGGLFGAFQAALFMSLVFLVLSTAGWQEGRAQDEAVLYPPVASVLPATWGYVAEHVPRARRFSDQMGERVEAELF